MDHDELRRAYSILELTPPISETLLKCRYKQLVRRWHPDRYQSDPVGQAEATARLREINIAYDVVATSLGVVVLPEQGRLCLPKDEDDDSNEKEIAFSWSKERVDAIVDSINRRTKVSLTPEMSVHRWLSLGAVFLYFYVAIFVLPASALEARYIARAMGRVRGYFWLPLYLIWTADRSDRSTLASEGARVVGWALMAAPAIIAFALWMAR